MAELLTIIDLFDIVHDFFVMNILIIQIFDKVSACTKYKDGK